MAGMFLARLGTLLVGAQPSAARRAEWVLLAEMVQEKVALPLYISNRENINKIHTCTKTNWVALPRKQISACQLGCVMHVKVLPYAFKFNYNHHYNSV